MLFLSLVVLAGTAQARQITFPPVTGIQHSLGNVHHDNSPFDQDISSALFSGLTTYANLPYVHCLSKHDDDVEKYDIAILGAPFDTVGSTPA